MSKNNYIIEKEKQIARLRHKVMIDSAYIGAGFVLLLDELKYTDDEIVEMMARVNAIWTELAKDHINPISYCREKTGFQLITDEKEVEEINKAFAEGDY